MRRYLVIDFAELTTYATDDTGLLTEKDATKYLTLTGLEKGVKAEVEQSVAFIKTNGGRNLLRY